MYGFGCLHGVILASIGAASRAMFICIGLRIPVGWRPIAVSISQIRSGDAVRRGALPDRIFFGGRGLYGAEVDHARLGLAPDTHSARAVPGAPDDGFVGGAFSYLVLF